MMVENYGEWHEKVKCKWTYFATQHHTTFLMEAKRAAIYKAVTCTAPVNIAVIKYWGKRDEELILPINSSLSGTLSQDELHAKTSVAVSNSFESDRIWLNDKEEDINNPRLQNCLREIRARLQAREPDSPLLAGKVHICSANNFPTAAGLASSAAGYACLVFALGQVFGVADTELSSIARVGSGSACRSVYGGFVSWEMGARPDGQDSIAVQVAPASHWPEMHVLILVVNSGRKAVSSTTGMETTVQTSTLIGHRASVVVPRRMEEMKAAITARDFETFGRLTIQDSNQFHAVCLDTYPPITYLNDTSRAVIDLCTRYNKHAGKIKAAYTFDAGPNAVIYALAADVPEILSLVAHYFPSEGNDFFRGRSTSTPAPLADSIAAAIPVPQRPGALQYVLHTAVGEGPQVLDEKASLLSSSGFPL
eukprot:m.37298 g.37298  ORF g.37298 m.37298 type:complete len:422 (-) comp5437_c0_seq4:139-1404(-)